MKAQETFCLIRQFYQIQEHRIAFQGQLRAIEAEKGEPSELLRGYFERMHSIEKDINKDLTASVKDEPVWNNYLKEVKGIGPLIASGLINLIDIKKAKHVSSLWMLAGLDVYNEGDDKGKAKRLRKGVKATWNPLLKSLCWKIGKSMLMGKNEFFRDIYDNRKAYEISKNAERSTASKLSVGHVDARAKRYMVKMFLRQLWVRWREMEGLSVTEPYAPARMEGHGYNPDIDNK